MKYVKIIIGILIGLIISYNNHLLYIPDIEINREYNLQYYVDIISAIALIFYIIIILLKTEKKSIEGLKVGFLILLDIFLLISNSFIKEGNLSFLYGGIDNIFYNILLFILNYIVLKRTLIFIENLIVNHKFKVKESKLIKLFNKNPFLFSLITILIFWTIYIIAFYPIILSPDPSFQIKQFFNVHTKYADYVVLLDNSVFLTNHHPVVHTLLLGGCLSLGRVLLNDNFGLFIYSMIQIILMASTLSYTIKYLKENNVNSKICTIILLIYCLVPMFPMYAMSGVKDTIYTCFIIWYVLRIDKLIRFKEDKVKLNDLIILFSISILLTLFRNNGIYVIFLSFPFLIIYLKKSWKQLLIVFVGIISFNSIFNNIILPYYKITGGSIRETLSIPFQQTARYVKYYDNEISEEDKKIIDRILTYDTLAKRYDPTISDPVKNVYNKYTTNEELFDYFKVWLKGLLKHPVVYIEATLHNIYGYFSLQSTNWYVYYKYDTRITQDNLVNYHYNTLENIRLVLSGYGQGFPYIPFIGLISNIGFNTWILLGLSFYSVLKKKKEYLIVLSPLLVTLLICVASPVNTYFRYAMPYIFIIPCIFTLFSSRIKKQ